MVQKRIKFKELVATFNHGDMAFLKSIFEAYSIRYHVEGEHFMQLRPLAVPAKIHVDETQYEEALALIKDFESGRFGFQPDQTP